MISCLCGGGNHFADERVLELRGVARRAQITTVLREKTDTERYDGPTPQRTDLSQRQGFLARLIS